MQGYFDKSTEWLKRLIGSDMYFLYVFFILLAVNPIISPLLRGEWVDFFFLLGLYYFFAVLATCFLSLLGKTGTILKQLSLVLGYVYIVIALFCRIKFRAQFDIGVLDTLLATNTHEISEFFSAFVPWWLRAVSILLLVAILVGHYLCRNRWSITASDRHTTLHLYLFAYCAIVLLICHRKAYTEFERVGQWRIPFENVAIDLKEHEPKSIPLVDRRTKHPQKVVLIIGESHALNHSSLYGYQLNTSPELNKMRSDSSLCVFTNAFSPATATIEAFKYILNTRQTKDFEQKWYLFPSVITMMHSAGYHTEWLSNQEEVGFYDNMASCYAHLCNSYMFNDNDEKLDGNLLGKHRMRKGREFVIYHLMGQHVEFAKRYPAEYDKFKAKDYKNVKCNDLNIMAQYDNACLYNDFVVASLMNEYRNEDAVVIYFPDHGLDVYYSSPGYFGHARQNPKSNLAGTHIPFLVYTSPSFRKFHPEQTERIRANQAKQFSTANITYMVMDIAGYDLKGSCNVKQFSPLAQ